MGLTYIPNRHRLTLNQNIYNNMKKHLLLAITLILSISSFSQIKFENKEWEDCRIPIIKLSTSTGYKLFILDTGSSFSFIDIKYAENNGIFDGVDGNIDYCSVSSTIKNNGSFYKVSIINRKWRMVTTDLTSINANLHGYHVVGILGIDFIMANKLIINFIKREVKFNN